MRGILHIGAEKTGTTTLQAYFHANRALLRRHRVAFPRFPGARQHSLLALYAMDPDRQNRLTRTNPRLRGSARDAWRAELRGAAFDELMPVSTSARDVLLSTELCHSQLKSAGEIERLKSLLDLWCEDYSIVFYLRRQDEMAVSLYSTYLRTGGTGTGILPPTPGPGPLPRYYDFESILDDWSQVFGRHRIVARVFDRSRLVGGDLIRDFFDAAGLQQLGGDGVRPPRRNTALSATSQELLRNLNLRLYSNGAHDTHGQVEIVRRAAIQALEAADGGRPLRPARQDAEAFYRAFEESNARVARTWFGQAALFGDDFSMYPESEDPRPPLDEARLMQLMQAAGRVPG